MKDSFAPIDEAVGAFGIGFDVLAAVRKNRHGPKVTQPATAEDAALVAAAVARHGSQSAAARAHNIPQPRLSAAREAGRGRALSKPQRARLSQETS